MEKKKMKVPIRAITLAAAVCSLFLFSGCAASKNMLAAIFGGNSGNGVPFHAASDDGRQMVNPDTAYKLARHFQKSGLHHKAVAELLKVVKTDPEHANAYNALGVSYDRLREFDLAAVSYQEALKIAPGLDYVYNNIGYSNLLQGNLDAAAQAFETAVALNREKLLYRNNLALVYARLGRDGAEHVAAAGAQPAVKSAAGVASVAAGEPAAAGESVSAVGPVTAGESTVSAVEPVSAIEPFYTAAATPAISGDDTSAASATSAGVPAKAAMQEPYYTIQLGVYYDMDKARSAVKDALETGIKRLYITKVDRGEPYKPYYRVRFGKYHNKNQAVTLAAEVRKNNQTSAFATIETGPLENVYAVADTKFNDMDMRPTIIKTNHDIEILNGNGVHNMARGMRQYLTKQGVEVKKIANARHFHHPRTIIYYSPGYYAEAQKILAQIHKIQPSGKIVESRNLDKTIQIVLGRDIKPAAAKLRKNS